MYPKKKSLGFQVDRVYSGPVPYSLHATLDADVSLGGFMAEMLRMPGRGCRFSLQGRCLYVEFLNPGLDPAFRCRVLARLEQRFDVLVDRCECRGIGLEAAGRIWQSWCDSVEWTCPDYAPHSDPEATDPCVYLSNGLCLLRYPVCEGRCRHYELARPGRNIEE